MLRITGKTHPLSILMLKRKGLFQLDFYNKTQRMSQNIKSRTYLADSHTKYLIQVKNNKGKYKKKTYAGAQVFFWLYFQN